MEGQAVLGKHNSAAVQGSRATPEVRQSESQRCRSAAWQEHGTAPLQERDRDRMQNPRPGVSPAAALPGPGADPQPHGRAQTRGHPAHVVPRRCAPRARSPVGMPSSLEPLPKPFTTSPRQKYGRCLMAPRSGAPRAHRAAAPLTAASRTGRYQRQGRKRAARSGLRSTQRSGGSCPPPRIAVPAPHAQCALPRRGTTIPAGAERGGAERAGGAGW